ncbi:hypothetical protein ILUMI_00082 [Ignelater luminosus]|uniref:Uncharacterized protein n=1 Tax=Ignelater luminosus TaxID=2038154 RepID=A0A8K0DN03_IGNLU|nr:hypothetical protein ILUMI_00082 [Ignelater luminosus]
MAITLAKENLPIPSERSEMVENKSSSGLIRNIVAKEDEIPQNADIVCATKFINRRKYHHNSKISPKKDIREKVGAQEHKVPADYAEVYSTPRKQLRPYNIFPGHKVGEKSVTNIRALCCKSVGFIDFKLRHSDDWQQLPKQKLITL